MCGLAWPPYSPDLSPLDLFPWGYIKDKVYQENPRNFSELEDKIIPIVKAIPDQMLAKSVGSFEHRLRLLTHTGGQHIEMCFTKFLSLSGLTREI